MFATITARIQAFSEPLIRWASSPLKSLGFSPLQAQLTCIGLSLVFFHQIAAPRIDQMNQLRNKVEEISGDIQIQELTNEQLAEWNRLLEEDPHFRLVQYRKLTGYRLFEEYTLEEFLQGQTPQS